MSCNEETTQLNRVVTISYITIQVSIAIVISIIGAIHVKRCKDEEEKSIHVDKTIALNTGHSACSISSCNIPVHQWHI